MKELSLLITIKRGDTRNAIHAILKRKGKAGDLTGCTVTFYMDNGIKSVIDVLDAKNGEVFYALEKSAVSKSGYFRYEFKVTYEDGRIQTFPEDSQMMLEISNDIGGI